MTLHTKLTSVSVRAYKNAQEAAAFARRLHVHYQNPPPTPFRRELLLTLTTFQTGVLDAATFIGFGLFVSNMTGNVILLGAAIADLYQHDVAPNIIALIAAKCIGINPSLSCKEGLAPAIKSLVISSTSLFHVAKCKADMPSRFCEETQDLGVETPSKYMTMSTCMFHTAKCNAVHP